MYVVYSHNFWLELLIDYYDILYIKEISIFNLSSKYNSLTKIRKET